MSALIELKAEFGPGPFFVFLLVVPAVIAKEFAGLVDACAHFYPIDPKILSEIQIRES